MHGRKISASPRVTSHFTSCLICSGNQDTVCWFAILQRRVRILNNFRSLFRLIKCGICSIDLTTARTATKFELCWLHVLRMRRIPSDSTENPIRLRLKAFNAWIAFKGIRNTSTLSFFESVESPLWSNVRLLTLATILRSRLFQQPASHTAVSNLLPEVTNTPLSRAISWTVFANFVQRIHDSTAWTDDVLAASPLDKELTITPLLSTCSLNALFSLCLLQRYFSLPWAILFENFLNRNNAAAKDSWLHTHHESLLSPPCAQNVTALQFKILYFWHNIGKIFLIYHLGSLGTDIGHV